MENGLYIIGTPIGNLSDISQRAIDVLSAAAIVYAEDTRVSGKLLQAINVKKELRTIQQHSTDRELRAAVEQAQNAVIAYISDAGTPGISDPGGKLVEAAYNAEALIVPVPGPSAVVTALSVCGFPSDSFTFLGFPPVKKGRNKFFESFEMYSHTVVMYESKHRIQKTIDQLPDDRMIFIGRELTKMHETLYRGFKSEIIDQIRISEKGEFVIVLAPIKYGK